MYQFNNDYLPVHTSITFIYVNFIEFRIVWFESTYFSLGQLIRAHWSTSVQFSSVTQSCPTLCDPMNCSTPGLLVHHHFLEFTQTHVHWVGDAIRLSHPLSSPSPPATGFMDSSGAKDSLSHSELCVYFI